MSWAAVEAAFAGAALAAALPDLGHLGRRGHGRRGARLLARAGRLIRLDTGGDHLQHRIDAAGLSPQLAAGDLMAIKLGAALTTGLLFTGLTFAAGAAAVLLVALAPALAFMAPDLVLRVRIDRRRAAIERELPDIVDLLAVAIEAGLAPGRALAEVAAGHRGMLSSELRDVAGRAQLGELRSDALGRLRSRCPHDGVAALVAALERADRHGAPLAPMLTQLAVDARRQRAAAIRERAARAAPKIQLAIALGLVPATLLLVAAALAGSFT